MVVEVLLLDAMVQMNVDAVPNWFVSNIALSLAREQDNITIHDPTDGLASEFFGEDGEFDKGARGAAMEFESDGAVRGEPDGFTDGTVTIPFALTTELPVGYDGGSTADEAASRVLADCEVDGEIVMQYGPSGRMDTPDTRAWVDLTISVPDDAV
jgi:hypothetical protein